jgi:hypothetical protein
LPAIKRWLRRGASSRASPLPQHCQGLLDDQARKMATIACER